jgi:hypothetical protein
VNALRFSITAPSSSKGVKDAPRCQSKFVDGLINGCNGNDPVSNFDNRKYGGVLTTSEGWIFNFTALSNNTAAEGNTCDFSYQIVDDYFEIRGKYWPDAKLGQEGEGLYTQVKGCGVVKEWEFVATPSDCCYQWYAHFKLPILTQFCVVRAIKSAGGVSAGNC